MNNEYLRMVEEAQKRRIYLTTEQKKRIVYMYKEISTELNKKLKKANPESLNERWLEDFQKQFKKEIKEMNKILKKDIENTMYNVSSTATNIQMNFLGMVDTKYKINHRETFSNMFSKIPKQAVTELINGDFYKDGKGLSHRIWFNEKKANADFDYIIQKGLAEKKSVYDLANDLVSFVNPSAKREWDFNKIYPGVSKNIEYNSFRLAVTSISHAYQLSMKRSCKANPFVEGIQWHTSNSHRRPCGICEGREGKIYSPDELPMDHPNGVCYFIPVINKSMEDIGSELHDWVHGGNNERLDNWYSKYIFNNKINNIDYMSNRFIPKFGDESVLKMNSLSFKVKKVVNSNFDMWASTEATNKNKAIRLYEKKINEIQKTLPEDFKLPKVMVIDFESNGINKNAIAGYNRCINTMFINSKYDTDKKILKYLNSSKGYFANTSPNAHVLHELGHKYHYDIVETIANNKNVEYNMAKEIFEEPINQYIINNSKVPNDIIAREISSYAFKKYKGINRVNEIMAEFFTIRDTENDFVKLINENIREVIGK